ncbi:MAG: RNA polymerase sigma factor RpoD [Phycisphaerae bacterium]|nr:RNA polymerase sigma factor RpoD [Phycisphaerae bacterium]
MANYRLADLKELAHQLTLSPRRHRLRQIQGAEHLLELIEATKEYPYDFVCYHVTGFRPVKASKRSTLKGAALITDLVRLIEQLSQSAAIPQSALTEPHYTQEQLSARWQVSTKTIARWRQRGLAGWRVVDEDRVQRLVFSELALRRFVSRNMELVRRGMAFKQLSSAEHERILNRARQLVREQRVRLQDAARTIAGEMGRAVETIRYTLRRHDHEHPAEALFASNGRPRLPDDYQEIFNAWQQGDAVMSLARRFGRKASQIEAICREMAVLEWQNRPPVFVPAPEFDLPEAEQDILDAAEPSDDTPSATLKPPADAPAYLKALYATPLLSAAQERDLFRRYNYCKFRAWQLSQKLEPERATAKQISQTQRYLELAEKFQNRLLQANLRLVVSIANRHAHGAVNLFELVSDGNMSLLRAVERFDYQRGYKFSTYATWAIMKNFARTIPEERGRYQRYVTGQEELLEAAADHRAAEENAPVENDSLRSVLRAGIAQLDEREQAILTAHYGLNQPQSAVTLEQLGERFGVTKERIRQIEKRALVKLRSLLPPTLGEQIHAA